jgi:hypothetical protein
MIAGVEAVESLVGRRIAGQIAEKEEYSEMDL